MASAIPILDAWAIGLDGLFVMGSGPSIDPSVVQTLSYTDPAAALSVQPSMFLDSSGLGDMLLSVTNTSASSQTATVTTWVHFYFYDDATSMNFFSGFYGGVVGTPLST